MRRLSDIVPKDRKDLLRDCNTGAFRISCLAPCVIRTKEGRVHKCIDDYRFPRRDAPASKGAC